MSFAATLAIVAGYQGSLVWTRGDVDTPLGARLALFGVREIVSLILVSLLAGFATTLYTAYHFHRLTPYGVITNLLAMPVVSAWVMPMGILGVLTIPLGFDALFWRLMAAGLDWMIAVAAWVTSLPGSVGRMTAFGIGPLLLGSAGLVALGLLKTPLRLAGAALMVIAGVWALRAPLPDVLVAPDGTSFAVRSNSGHLSFVRTGSDTFAFREWLAADADARTRKDRTLGQGIACDEAGCVGRLRDGAVVAIARTIEAFDDDCRRADLIVSPRDAPAGFAPTLVDRDIWRHAGAVALRHVGKAWRMEVARPAGYDRPWAPAIPAPRRLPSQDATPNDNDIDP
jgi:competence protein ComEC